MWSARELEDSERFTTLSEDEKRLAIRKELAANLFRATQAEDKLRRDKVQGKQQANQTHFDVGQKVRQTIVELGGTLPEHLPTPYKSIKHVENAQKRLEKQQNDDVNQIK